MTKRWRKSQQSFGSFAGMRFWIAAIAIALITLPGPSFVAQDNQQSGDQTTVALYDVAELLATYVAHDKINDVEQGRSTFRTILESIVYTDDDWFEKTADGQFVKYRNEQASLQWHKNSLILDGTETQHANMKRALAAWREHGFDDQFVIDCIIVSTTKDVARSLDLLPEGKTGKHKLVVRMASSNQLKKIAKTLVDAQSTSLIMTPRIVVSMNSSGEIHSGSVNFVSLPQTIAHDKSLYRAQRIGQYIKTRVIPSLGSHDWTLELQYENSRVASHQQVGYDEQKEESEKIDAAPVRTRRLNTGFVLDEDQACCIGVPSPTGSENEFEILVVSYRKLEANHNRADVTTAASNLADQLRSRATHIQDS